MSKHKVPEKNNITPEEAIPDNEPVADINTEKLQSLEEALKKEQDSYLRLRAEFDNYRKRAAVEKEEFVKYATANVLNEILPIIDNFERAQQSFEKHKDEKEEIIKGVALIHKQLEDLLQKFGIKKIECLGKPFDPATQEAIMQKETTEGEDNIVLEVVQPGYQLEDKVIRHAMVIVSKKK